MFGRSRILLRFAPIVNFLSQSTHECSFITAIVLTVVRRLRDHWVDAGIAIALQIIAASAAPAIHAEPLVPGGSPVLQREILALYDGREEARSELTRIHRMVEMPLNHLGY